MTSTERRMAESASMMLIGEGALALWRPRAHCRLWRGSDGTWSHMVDWFVDRPRVVRALGAAEIAAGLWLAFRQEDGAARPVADGAAPGGHDWRRAG